MQAKSCPGHHCPDLSVAGVDFHKRHDNGKCHLKSSSPRCSRPASRPLPRLPRSPGSSVSITDSAYLHLRSLLRLLKQAATFGGPLSSQTSWVRRAAHLPGGHLGLWGHGSVRWWLLSPELGALKSQAWPCPQGPPALPPLEPTALATHLRAVQTPEPSPAWGQSLPSLWPEPMAQRGPCPFRPGGRTRGGSRPLRPRFLLPSMWASASHISGHVCRSAPESGSFGTCDAPPSRDLRPLPQVARSVPVAHSVT